VIDVVDVPGEPSLYFLDGGPDGPLVYEAGKE
jgi:hypothetical protein